MSHLRELLALLADGRFHSGVVLGQALGVSRAKVWLVLQELMSYGVGVEAVKGRGYRLARSLELLTPDAITPFLSSDTGTALTGLDIFLSLDSTNAYLMQRASEGAECGHVCLSEHQHAGKGRRGRSWVSPLGANLYLSVLWRFSDGPMRLGGLSLAVATAVVEALQECGVGGVAIKWPNDLVTTEGKVGGILLEVAGESSGPCHAVVGLGLNIDMPASAMSSVEQPWANLPRSGVSLSRNELTGRLINHLFRVLQEFPQTGLAPYRERWHRYDITYGKQVDLHLHDRIISGVARGVDEAGTLVLERDGQMSRYASGEVSLRIQRDAT